MSGLDIRIIPSEQMQKILPLVRQLNPGIPEHILAERLQQMIAGGYQCVGAFDSDGLIGIAGVWINTRFYCGRFLEVDNVVVDEKHRRAGIGHKLMDWIEQYGKDLHCLVTVFNCYVTNARAHKFYFERGCRIIAFHFSKDLD